MLNTDTANARQLAYHAARRAVRPKQYLTVSEWADKNRQLAKEGSAEPGQWKTSRAPYQREIMDALSEESKCREVVFMASSQIGKTEIGSNFLGYIIDHAKGPVAVVMPTEKALKDWFSQKFDPMAEVTPAVRDNMAGRSNKSGDNSAERKKFVGGILYAKTAGSTADLKSTSLRYAILDEVDEYDWSTNQGDPIELARVRLRTFHDRKLLIVSSPTVKDASKIEALFEGGDQRRFMLACPHCGERQHLQWSQMSWRKIGTSKVVSHAWYNCKECGGHIEEHQKTAMMAAGEWEAHNPDAPYRSYHINALYAPMGLGDSWLAMVNVWLEIQDKPEKLMVFCNTYLGESWADRTHDIKPNILIERAENYALGTVPRGCLILTAGIDVQSGADARLEIQVVGHGPGNRTWVIETHVIQSNPALDATWDDLAVYLNRTFPNEFGHALPIAASAIDSGGHHTHEVYHFVRSRRAKRCIAIKGRSTKGGSILGKPSKQDVKWNKVVDKRGVELYSVGTDTIKATLYARLNADGENGEDGLAKGPIDRMVHFSQELEPAYFDQLVSETYDPKKNLWVKKAGKRNEALDTWGYAYAAAQHPEINVTKKKKYEWDRLQLQLESSAPVEAAPSSVTPQKTASPQARAKPKPTARKRGGFVNSW